LVTGAHIALMPAARSSVAATEHLGYVRDLSLLVPVYATAAVLLWRRAAWGYVLAGERARGYSSTVRP
jgi:hypothetical protein